jgi:hypothetical protein
VEETTAVEEQAVSEEGRSVEEVGTTGSEDLAAVREVVLRAYPDSVPELVGGTSVAEVLASVEGARAAYRRVVEAVSAEAGSATSAPSVPAGAVTRPAVDPERLPAAEKIRRGVAARG